MMRLFNFPTNQLRFARGFTLIELMIVVTIIGILAAITYPSYMDSIRTANRKDAMGVVQAAAQNLERFALQNNTYVGATIPTKSPLDGTTVYTIEVTSTATTYTITAKPTGGINDGKNITLNETGARTWGSESTWKN